MLSIKDLSNKFTKELPGERAHKAFYPFRYNQLVDISNRKESAVAVHLFKKEEEFHFLLIKRSTYNGHHSGQIAFPGGKKDTTDDTLEYTSRRESFEELGIPIERGNLLKVLTPVYIPVSNFMVNPFVFLHPLQPMITINEEVVEVYEVSLEQLLDETNICHTDIQVGNTNMKNIPAYNFENCLVWGATALILSELKEILV